METTKQQKDPLFAGLAREARWLGLPINIFILFLFSAFFLFFGIKAAFGGFFKPVLSVAALYAYLTALTYQEDRGVNFALFKHRRRFTNSQKMYLICFIFGLKLSSWPTAI